MNFPHTSLLKPPHAWSKPHQTPLPQIQQDLTHALHSAFPSHPTYYERVIAVLIHFDNDDRGVGPHLHDLGNVFVREYGFEVRHVTLHANGNASVCLKSALLDLEKQGYKSGNLIVLVFAGHGEVCKDKYTARISLKIGYVLLYPFAVCRWIWLMQGI
jgi:hypothetical protein